MSVRDWLLERLGGALAEAIAWRRRHPCAYAELLRRRSVIMRDMGDHWARKGRKVLSRIARRRSARLARRADRWDAICNKSKPMP